MTIKLNPKSVVIVVRRKDMSLCLYPVLDRALGSFLPSGSFMKVYQMQMCFNHHVNFCFEGLRIFLIPFFGLYIRKLENG